MDYTEENNGKDNESHIQESEQPNTIANNKEIDVLINTISEESKNIDDINEKQNDNRTKEFIILNLDDKFNDVMIKANELIEKRNVYQGRKTTTTWVQFNKIYGKSSPHFGRYGRYGAGGNGGEPMDPGSRNYFVRFVFMILLVMLLITASYGALVLLTPALKSFYLKAGLFMMLLSAGVLIGMNYVMICSACARVPPCNFICLVIVVVAMSNLVAAVTVRYKTQIVIMAVIATAIIVALCVLLACTSFDFTQWYIYVVIIAMVFAGISIVCSITMLGMGMKIKPLQLVLLCVGTLLQAVILIMELQMILGGRSIEISEDDYALGAYMLYTSIIEIFLHMVQIMGILDK